MKTRNWILAVSIVVVLAFFVAYGQSSSTAASAKRSGPAVGMGDFRLMENQAALSGTGDTATALRAGMGDLRILEASQNARVGFGDLRKLEADQARASIVGIGDLRLFEAGR